MHKLVESSSTIIKNLDKHFSKSKGLTKDCMSFKLPSWISGFASKMHDGISSFLFIILPFKIGCTSNNLFKVFLIWSAEYFSLNSIINGLLYLVPMSCVISSK